MKDQILESYKKNKKTYHDFRERVVHLLTDLLSEQEIQIHQISSRTKSLESLSKKIDAKNEKYNRLDEITDIVGIRIIAYLESHVDVISDLIEKEFIKDHENSIDKRKLKSDQFGYRSLHIVASFNADRCNLKEYKRYKEIKCEIQVRSILQHAWAEIEHDLGYKGEISIPDQYKRTFNRLSALLETADIEFDRLKLGLENYERGIPDLIKSESEVVDINSASISYFIDSNAVLLECRNLIQRKVGSKLRESDEFDSIIKNLNHFGFLLIGDLEKTLELNRVQYLKFVNLLIESLTLGGTPYKTATLSYFTHYFAAKSKNIDVVRKYFEVFFGSDIWATTEHIARSHIDIYNKSLM